MRDLHLWRLLQHPTLDAAEITPLLADLARFPLVERMPFLGLLGGALGHADSAVRKAAVEVLAGCTGRAGLQKIVHALDDAEEAVRRAAVTALRESLRDDPLRWAHVLFHPQPGVRLAAIEEQADFPLSFLYKLYLLADLVCRGVVERHMQDARLDAEGLPLLFDFLRQGVVTPAAARRLANALSWNDWLGFLGDLLPRSHDMADSLAGAVRPEWAENLFSHYRPDRLDELLLLFWDVDQPQQTDSPHGRFFDLLWEAALDESAYFQQWLVFTLLGVAVQKGSWPERAAQICAILYPPFLGCPWVPLAVRRAALSAFNRAGQRGPRWPAVVIEPLVKSELCQEGVPGQPVRFDLRAVGALLHALDGAPYQCLAQWVPLAEIAAAFQSAPQRAMPLLSVPDPSTRGRILLLRELCRLQGPQRFRMLALIAQAVPGDVLDVLDHLDGAGACGVVEHLLELEAGPAVANVRPLSENKVRRLAILLAGKIAAGQVERFLRVWLSRTAPHTSALAPAILARLLHDHGSRLVHPALLGQPVSLLQRFLEAMPFCAGFPYDAEVRLAEDLAGHADDVLRTWAIARLGDHAAVLAAREAEELASTEPPDPVLRLGICAALEAQAEVPAPNVETCQALLASHDPSEEVAALLARFLSPEADFVTRLDAEMVKHWQGEKRLPFLGHVWLFRWDMHLSALSELLDPDATEPLPFAGRGPAAALRWALQSPSPQLWRRVWQAVAAVLEHWRWHARPLLHASWEQALADVLAEAVPSPVGDVAAGIILHWREHAGSLPQTALLDPLRQRLVALLPRLSEEMRRRFAGWIDARGLAPAPQPVAAEEPPSEEVIESDLELLAAWTHLEEEQLAVAGARRLLELGEPGRQRLAAAIDEGPGIRWPLHLLDELAGCEDFELRAALRRLTDNAEALPEVRFRIGQHLWSDGDASLLEALFDAVCRPGPVWYSDGDAHWLWLRTSLEETDFHLRLIGSPQPAAYGAAIDWLTRAGQADPRIAPALLDFLEAGSERMRERRLQAARWLYEQGQRQQVLPLLLGQEAKAPPDQPALLEGVPAPGVAAVTAGVLMSGLGEKAEEMLLALLEHGSFYAPGSWKLSVGTVGSLGNRVDPLARQEALGQLLSGATSLAVRQRVRRSLRSGLGRTHKLRRVAETFAWGVRIGRQLTGKLFSIEMIAGEELGYTRLRENKLFISPMPLLRGQQNAREVVRGLIVHEYGHHLYHKGDEAEAVWERAEQERLHRLLNLVSDEHLERNLRARDQSFGDQLKQLGAYAFQHTARDVPVETLLRALRSSAFAVLSATHLGVSRKKGCVLVSSGKVLMQMEKAGMSFARFVRALRMGLGNRHGDAKVAEALDLFKGRFRQSSMDDLMDITRKLRAIFGDETELLDAFNQDAALMGEADDLADASEGITNEELQAAVRRALEGPVSKGASDRGRGAGRGYNVDPSEEFEPIVNIVPKVHDPARHAVYADRVKRQAEKMRRYLRQLGLGLVPQRQRLRGKSFDRSQARAVVLRGDPRMLIARDLQMRTDLFLGVLIDCSGSMSSGDNIEKAKLFGTLLAEAARGNRGVDLRLWGFTDRTIYECGNAVRPAVHDLEPEDGNNDAAALWHAAQAARASQRRAKLLVMISDGSPTGCSVAALTALVERLTRRMKMLCAQVAVRPLDDISFPDYVLLEDDRIDESVKRFGAIMMKLVRQALRG
jgi:hypothetical protein